MQRTAIVTGASRGFGFAVAGELSGAGWNLVIDARTATDLEEAASSFSASGVLVRPIAGDVTDPDHALALVSEARGLGVLSAVINNAGILGPSPQPRLADYPLPTLDDLLDFYLIAPLRLIQLALPDLRRHRGAVVNVTSDAAVESYETWGGYGAAKAALEQMSNVLAAEESEISVYWLDPGDIRTRMHQEAFPGEDISDRPMPETRAPSVTRLLNERPPSGRYTAATLMETVGR